MKNEMEKTSFMTWCKFMFDENTHERWGNGQNPYKDFDTYYSKNLNWLREKYEDRTSDIINQTYYLS